MDIDELSQEQLERAKEIDKGGIDFDNKYLQPIFAELFETNRLNLNHAAVALFSQLCRVLEFQNNFDPTASAKHLELVLNAQIELYKKIAAEQNQPD